MADFNGDGKRDYLLFNASTPPDGVSGIMTQRYVLVSGVYGTYIAGGYQLQGTADFNGDGKPDYLFFGPSTRRTANLVS